MYVYVHPFNEGFNDITVFNRNTLYGNSCNYFTYSLCKYIIILVIYPYLESTISSLFME